MGHVLMRATLPPLMQARSRQQSCNPPHGGLVLLNVELSSRRCPPRAIPAWMRAGW